MGGPTPPGCWDVIASRLDDVIPLPSWPNCTISKCPLSHAAWNAITGTLDKPAPVKRPFSQALCAAAAAAVVLLLLAGGTSWLGGRYFKKDISTAQHSPLQLAPVPRATNNLPNDLVVQNVDDETETVDGHTGFSNTAHKPAPAANHAMKSAPVSIQPAHTEYPVTLNYASMPEDDRTMINRLDPSLTDNNYLVLTCPNGEVTKASLKMADGTTVILFTAKTRQMKQAIKPPMKTATGKNALLQEWRSRIMSSHFIPASANFLDIVVISKTSSKKKPLTVVSSPANNQQPITSNQ